MSICGQVARPRALARWHELWKGGLALRTICHRTIILASLLEPTVALAEELPCSKSHFA
jgi:hypothetical protein